jgi:hypothetical protein
MKQFNLRCVYIYIYTHINIHYTHTYTYLYHDTITSIQVIFIILGRRLHLIKIFKCLRYSHYKVINNATKNNKNKVIQIYISLGSFNK